jgi:uncharacterized protein
MVSPGRSRALAHPRRPGSARGVARSRAAGLPMDEIGGFSASTLILAFVAGCVVAVVTAPVGVSGAVFLLPVQLDLLRVPSPAVTPTNLLYNPVATPGALFRYGRAGAIDLRLTGQLLVGTVPGVAVGSVLRVYAAPGDRELRLLAAAVLLALGMWLSVRP